jgi:acyl carrier protein
MVKGWMINMITLKTLKNFISVELIIPAKYITLDSNFIQDLGMDPLSFVEFLVELEQTFNLDEIPDSAWESINTVKDLLDYINKE